MYFVRIKVLSYYYLIVKHGAFQNYYFGLKSMYLNPIIQL